MYAENRRYLQILGVSMASNSTQQDNVIELALRANRVDLDSIKNEYESSYKNYFGYAYSLTSSTDASKEIVQSVFARLVSRTKKKGFLHIENLEAYIVRSIRNEHVDRNKKELRNITIRSEETESHPSAEHIHFDGVQNESLSRAIQKLPTAQRTCVVMRYFDDFSVEKISKELGISKSAVKTHIQRARAALNRHLQDIEGGEAI